MPILAGIDPGISTGFAIIDFLPKPEFYKIIMALELRGTPREVASFISSQHFDFCAIEQFALVEYYAREVARNDHFMITPRTIGALEALIAPRKITIQLPATKRYTPDERLKEMGLWNKSGHVNDAFRHVVYLSRAFTRQMHSNKILGLSDFYSP